MWILRFDFEGMHASISRSASASRNQSASYPLLPRSDLAFGNASIIRAAPPKSLIWPLLSNKINGRPLPSHTACSFEFRPPLVRPIRLGIDPLRQAQDILFKRLAAVRCAFKCVASIINWSGLHALAARLANILLNTPIRLQRIRALLSEVEGRL